MKKAPNPLHYSTICYRTLRLRKLLFYYKSFSFPPSPLPLHRHLFAAAVCSVRPTSPVSVSLVPACGWCWLGPPARPPDPCSLLRVHGLASSTHWAANHQTSFHQLIFSRSFLKRMWWTRYSKTTFHFNTSNILYCLSWLTHFAHLIATMKSQKNRLNAIKPFADRPSPCCHCLPTHLPIFSLFVSEYRFLHLFPVRRWSDHNFNSSNWH